MPDDGKASGRALMQFLLLLLLFIAPALPGCSKQTGRPNIILVILDTVRSDYTGVGGDGRGLTPQLDRLADEGTVYQNAWATAPWTLPSHASIFTGMLSSSHGCHINHWKFDENHTTLAELLAQSEYETAAFFSNPWLNDRMTGILDGFEVRRESPLSDPDEMSMGRSDQGGRSINGNITAWLGRRDGGRPFFLFVNYLEAHLPFDPPAEYRQEHLSGLPPDDIVSTAWSEEFNAGMHATESVDWQRVHRLYGGDVNHADRFLSALISMLKAHAYYEKSIIIVTSDHGENLGEHNLMDHQFSIHETLLSVPLVIRSPDIFHKNVRSEPVMLIDLFATILELAGVNYKNTPHLSRSLVPLQDPDAAAAQSKDWGERLLIAEYGGGHPSLVNRLLELNPGLDPEPFRRGYRSVRWRDFRLTIGTDGFECLHDLSADPHQNENVIKDHPKIAEELYRSMKKLSSRELESGNEKIEIDEESLKKLRSLGYIK